MDLYTNIALKINKLITQNNLTIGGLAERISLTKQTLHYNMNGKSKFSIENLDKISKYFNVPISYFFEENGAALNMANESQASYGKNYDEQLKVKDEQIKQLNDQIKFLQKIIEEKL